METLSLRVERHAENTKKVVEYLANHPQDSVVAGVGRGNGGVLAGCFPVKFAAVHDDAAQSGAVTADELGGGMDYNVRAMLNGANQIGCPKRAITYTIQALAQAGDHIVAQKTIYGGSYNLLAHTLPQFGVSTTFVDAHDLNAATAAIRPKGPTASTKLTPW